MITTLALVKIFAELYTRSEAGAPESTDVGALGDIWLDNDDQSATYGATWECTLIVLTPTPAYTWTRLTKDDARITRDIPRAEQDYLTIRNKAFDVVDSVTVYPVGADHIAAEMVCYLSGYGVYQGRGMKDESLADRRVTYDDKILGYPASIVRGIKRYQGAK